MTLDEIYDGWDVTDDDCPIETCCRIRDANGKTCLLAAISPKPIVVAADPGFRAVDCWHEIEHLDKPSPRFSRWHAVLVHDTASAGVSPDVVAENLAGMKIQFLSQMSGDPGRAVSRIVAKDNGRIIMGMLWPPFGPARPKPGWEFN